jgi:hypothetical protein
MSRLAALVATKARPVPTGEHYARMARARAITERSQGIKEFFDLSPLYDGEISYLGFTGSELSLKIAYRMALTNPEGALRMLLKYSQKNY